MQVWRMFFLFKWVIFRFHVSFPGFSGSTIWCSTSWLYEIWGSQNSWPPKKAPMMFFQLWWLRSQTLSELSPAKRKPLKLGGFSRLVVEKEFKH